MTGGWQTVGQAIVCYNIHLSDERVHPRRPGGRVVNMRGMSMLPIVPPPIDAPAARDAAPGRGTAAADAPGRPPLRDEDLYDLLAAFYEAVEADAALAPYFASVDMVAHLPRIVDFWSTLVFHTGRYTGNAFRPHLTMPGLAAEHFARWVATLEATVDARHAGAAAEAMKDYGHRIAYSMQLRLGIVPFADYRAGGVG
jgi:hemoglobin